MAKGKWTNRAPGRTSGRKLQAQRRRLFERNPLCAACERKGLVEAATIRDHIVPLQEGGSDDDENIQGLCERCHDAKTKAEAKRGQGTKLIERHGCTLSGMPVDPHHPWNATS